MDNSSSSTKTGFIGRSRLLFGATLIGLLAIGMGIRLVNLTNPPLDFFAGRQLRSATIARGFYYQMDTSADPALRQSAILIGNDNEKMEPEIFEGIVALTYLVVGAEHLWIARLYAIIFWMIGGLALFGLARKLTSIEGAMVSLTFYLILEFGVQASRSFQPDPFMVMWILLAAYCLYSWTEKHTWGWAAAAGITSGVAVLVKAFAVCPIALIAVFLVLVSFGLKRALADGQVWLAAAIMIAIPAAYYLVDRSSWSAGYIGGWVLAYTSLIFKPSFYLGWLNLINTIMPLAFVIASLAGIFLLDRRGKAVAGGLWLGYVLLGLSVPELVSTHSYYSLPLVPIVALTLAPLGRLLFDKVESSPKFWQYVFAGIAFLALAYPAWNLRVGLLRVNYRYEEITWKKIGDALPVDGALIGLTADNGYRLRYYGWRIITVWPSVSDMKLRAMAGGNFDVTQEDLEKFIRDTQGYTYFMVSNPSVLDSQPGLKQTLYGHYQYKKIDPFSFLLFDLRTLK
jgi:4-amino-4-deoxy-L-arabinose transferase-like glycosyltransferase